MFKIHFSIGWTYFLFEIACKKTTGTPPVKVRTGQNGSFLAESTVSFFFTSESKFLNLRTFFVQSTIFCPQLLWSSHHFEGLDSHWIKVPKYMNNSHLPRYCQSLKPPYLCHCFATVNLNFLLSHTPLTSLSSTFNVQLTQFSTPYRLQTELNSETILSYSGQPSYLILLCPIVYLIYDYLHEELEYS